MTEDPRVVLLENALQGKSMPQNIHDRAAFILALIDDMHLMDTLDLPPVIDRPAYFDVDPQPVVRLALHTRNADLFAAAEQAKVLLAELDERRRSIGSDFEFWPWWAGQLAAQLLRFIELILPEEPR